MESNCLRKLDEHDADPLFALVENNRENLSKFSWATSVRSVKDSQAFIDTANRKEHSNGAPTRAICNNDELLGVVAIHPIDWNTREASVGYWIDQRQYGKGLVAKAVGHLIDHAFTNLQLNALSLSTDVDNRASRTVAEKLGFELEGIDTTATWHVDNDGVLQVAHYKRYSHTPSYT